MDFNLVHDYKQLFRLPFFFYISAFTSVLIQTSLKSKTLNLKNPYFCVPQKQQCGVLDKIGLSSLKHRLGFLKLTLYVIYERI